MPNEKGFLSDIYEKRFLQGWGKGLVQNPIARFKNVPLENWQAETKPRPMSK